jgi:hypothetical protein
MANLIFQCIVEIHSNKKMQNADHYRQESCFPCINSWQCSYLSRTKETVQRHAFILELKQRKVYITKKATTAPMAMPITLV